MATRSQIVAADIAASLRSRAPLIWITSREESRVERYLFEAAASVSYTMATWDCGDGPCDARGNSIAKEMGLAAAEAGDPGLFLRALRERIPQSARTLWVLRDMAPWLQPPIGLATLRQLRNLARMLPDVPIDNGHCIVVLSPSAEVPAELQDHAVAIQWPLPDREEIRGVLDVALLNVPEDKRAMAAPNGQGEAAIDAALGLSADEAASCYAKSLVQTRRIDPVVIASEKKAIIAKSGVLQWLEPLPGGLANVGGLDNLKAWCAARAACFSSSAKAYGLPTPKGILLVGVPGGGKSMFAKALAYDWKRPLLKGDLNALKGKFVGQSEANIRRMIEVLDSIGPCVLFIDEIEKALAGATQGAADGGVSADALGQLLSWLQDKTSQCFVVATANNVESLPPELLRKGRFDELFFVDLPNATERAAIISATLTTYRKSVADDYMLSLVPATDGFTGSEVAETVPSAMYTAYADNARDITCADLLAAARATVPLSKTAKQKIDAIRSWGSERARPASRPDNSATLAVRPALRALDM
jgi:MoxR-like ATPase